MTLIWCAFLKSRCTNVFSRSFHGDVKGKKKGSCWRGPEASSRPLLEQSHDLCNLDVPSSSDSASAHKPCDDLPARQVSGVKRLRYWQQDWQISLVKLMRCRHRRRHLPMLYVHPAMTMLPTSQPPEGSSRGRSRFSHVKSTSLHAPFRFGEPSRWPPRAPL